MEAGSIPRNVHSGRGRTLELAHVRQVRTSVHDISGAGTGFVEGAFNLGESKDGLLVDAVADHLLFSSTAVVPDTAMHGPERIARR